MKNSFIIILSAIMLYSCSDLETVIDLDVPVLDPVLVLNSSVRSDSEIKVFVSHSLDAFGNMVPSNIDDATVLLFEDNQFVDSLYADLSDPNYYPFYSSDDRTIDSVLVYYYKSDVIADPNKSYRLEASHPMYPSVIASTTIPNGVEIELLQSFNPQEIKFNFNDDPSKENFYELKLMARFTKEFEGEVITFTERVEFASNDLSFPSSIPFEGFSFYGRKVFFDDAIFNGSQKQISIEIVDDFDLFAEESDSIYFQFTELSSEAFSYYKSRNSQIEGGAAGIFGGEVTPVFSNVENGLGAFFSVNSQNVTAINNLSE
ncbi:MAG: DUF4249 domain-containing protein [Flavobacteriales bacterium]